MKLVKFTDTGFPTFPSFIDNLMSRDWLDWSGNNFSTTNTTLPATNIMEDEEKFRIEVAAPGMEKKDFNIKLENDRLLISSERKAECDKEEDNYYRREFSYQSFQRSFALPENLVETDKIEAVYDKGILKVTLPKRDEVKPKPPKEIKIS
jgi:HSP20 family protein